MYLTIESIERVGRGRRARRLSFAAGREPRTTAAAVVRVMGIEAGDVIDSAEFEATLESAEATCARERALRVLGYRDRASREIERRLIDDGYPAGVVRELLVRLTELELIDDERFAISWARTRSTAGFGRDRVARELREKGVAPLHAQAALDTIFPVESDVERARAALRGRVPRDAAEREKLLRRLLRRGFSLETARKAVPPLPDAASDCLDEGGEEPSSLD